MSNFRADLTNRVLAWVVVLSALTAGITAYVASFTLFGLSEKHSRGLDYIPDMYVTPALKSQHAREVVLDADGKAVAVPATFSAAGELPKGGQIRDLPTVMRPPTGTVSRDFVPYPYEPSDFIGPHNLQNPLAPTAEALRSGQKYFNIYCVVCHGNDGNGAHGYVAAKFNGGVPSLNGPNLNLLSDGDIYHIVTNGRVRMPDYRAQLLPEQRWAVINYVRLLNRATQAITDADAVLAAAEQELKNKPNDAGARAAYDAAKGVAAHAKHDLELIKRGGGEEFKPAPAAKPEYIAPSWPKAITPSGSAEK
jgi:mono/diheme cytochrome c family protein